MAHTARTRRKPYLLTAAAGMFLCTSCVAAEPAGTSAEDSPAAKPAPTGSSTARHSVGENPQAPMTKAPENPEWRPDDAQAAKQTAANVLRDFARPDMDHTQWANDLARWLTPEATAAYSSVDPANIPVRKITGPAALDIDGTNGFGAVARIPTDIGTYEVQLLRQGQDDPWKVNRIHPPGADTR